MLIKEDQRTELKRQITEDLKKEVVAFANSEGGTVYIGIDDDGSAVGVSEPSEDMDRIRNMIRDSIKPDITMFVAIELQKMDDRNVIAVRVQQGPDKPYYLSSRGLKPSGVFLRQGSSSAPASMNAIRTMIKETDGDRYETMRSLNQELSFQYLQEEFTTRNLPLGEAQMITLGLITGDEKIYTNLGLLLSDQCVHTLKVAVFQGISKEVFKDRREFQGSLLKQLNESYNYLDMINKTKAVINGLRRLEKRDYPEIAVREALINAIVHREYSASSSTLISVFDDRIEIISFGGLVKGITLKDVMFGISITRNEKLAAVLYRLKLIEAYGTGITKVMESYIDHITKPSFEVSDNAFKVVLPNRNYNFTANRAFSSRESEVFDMIRKKGSICRKDVENHLDISQTMAGRILKALEQKDVIVRIGKGSKTFYALPEF